VIPLRHVPGGLPFRVWFLKGWEFFLRSLTFRSAAAILADFNNPVASLEAGLDPWPRTLESREES
jgi:hypothetical protein